MADEVWKPVVGYETYYMVSSQGRIKSLPRTIPMGRSYPGKMLTLTQMKSGHIRIRLCDGLLSTQKQKLVHRLVLEAFVGPCPEGMEACHRNDIPTDNRLENLYWGTRSDNMRDRRDNGYISPNAIKTHCKYGHPFDEDNTYRWKNRRYCKLCRDAYEANRPKRTYKPRNTNRKEAQH